MKRKRVLFVGPYPPPYAGPEIGTKMLLDSSLRDDFKLLHLNTNVRKSNAEKGRLDTAIFIGFIRFVLSLSYMIVRHRPDVVYYLITATMIGWVRDSAAIILSRLLGRKLIVQLRGGHFRIFYENCGSTGKSWLRFMLRRCQLVIVQAHKLKSQFTGLVKDERICVLYNAIESEQAPNRKAEVSNGKIKILFVGHLSFAKGYCDLLKSIKHVVEHVADVEFQFAGTKIKKETNVFFNQVNSEALVFEDPDEVYEEHVLSRGLERYVRFLGLISGQEKANVFSAADVFVLPSYSEGFSMSVLEAFAAGIPVVVTPVGALDEIVKDGENGYVVKPGDPVSLAEAIRDLAENADVRIRMGQRNQAAAREVFDISIIAKRLGQYFNLVIGST